MSCHKIREGILEQMDGRISEEDSKKIESHLFECSGCRDYRAGLGQLSSFIKAAPRYQAPPHVWGQIRATIEAPRLTGSNVIEILRENLRDFLFEHAWVRLAVPVVAVCLVAVVLPMRQQMALERKELGLYLWEETGTDWIAQDWGTTASENWDTSAEEFLA